MACRSPTRARAASDPDAVAALAATAIRHVGRLADGSALRPGADHRARGRRRAPCSSHPRRRGAGCSCWSSRTRTSAGSSTTSAGIARRSRPSCELGRHPRRRVRHPLLAAQHPQPSEATAPTGRPRLHRRGGGRAPGGVHPPRADPGGDRAGPGRAAAGPRWPCPRPTSWSSPAPPPPAPALVWATLEAHRRDPDAAVLSLHADWWIGEPEAFRRTADLALRTARTHDRLVTVGMVPTRPETGYGYIVPGRRSTPTPRGWSASRKSPTPPLRST